MNSTSTREKAEDFCGSINGKEIKYISLPHEYLKDDLTWWSGRLFLKLNNSLC